MRLVSCYIENYGKISRKSFLFDALTVFCEENGYGKTTLASFLKAMFYGLPTTRANSTGFDDRQHFYPFNGGKFGGSLVFEQEGTEYRIERFFDRKSDSKDECTVYCNGAVTARFGAEIGKSVFGLDEDSFERTVFVSAGTDVFATGGINAKLNQCVDDTAQERGYENAREILGRRSRELKAARGNGGTISRLREEMNETERKIVNLEKTEAGLRERYADRAALEREILELSAEEKRANGERLLLQKWETYDGYRRDAGEREERRRLLLGDYPRGLPSREECELLSRAAQELSEAESALSALSFGEEKERRYREDARMFARGVPSAEELSAVQDMIDEYDRLGDEPASAEGSSERAALERRFGGRVPEEEEISRARNAAKEYREAEKELRYASSAGKNDGRKRSPAFAVIAVLALLLAAAGVGLLFVSHIAGAVLLAAGLCLLAADGFLYLKGLIARSGGKENGGAALRLSESEHAVRTFLAPYGYYGDNGAAYDFSLFEADLARYRELIAVENGNLAARRRREERRGAVAAELARYLDCYCTGGNFRDRLLYVREKRNEYLGMTRDLQEYRERRSLTEARALAAREALGGISEKYGLDARNAAAVKAVMEAGAESDRLEREILQFRRRAEDFAAQNGLAERPKKAGRNAEEIGEFLRQKRKLLSDLDSAIRADENETERLPDLRGDFERLQESYAEAKEQYAVLEAAIEELDRAERRLKDKYIAPVKERFLHYSRAVEEAFDDKITMDKDFRIGYEEGGVLHGERHLSAGQRSICSLCLRLSLIDNMFERERPFLILDDPFVHLDEAHMKKTAAVLRLLSQETQIVYFCCHASRTV